MDKEERDQANAALALDAQIAERIQNGVLRAVETDTTDFIDSLWNHWQFGDLLRRAVDERVNIALETNLQYYLDRMSRPRGY